MSLRIVLAAVGLVTVGWVLFWTLVAMGPIAWVVIVPMLVVGVVQVYRKRRGRRPDDGVRYCPNCGAEIVPPTDDGEAAAPTDRPTVYCVNCGESVDIDGASDATPTVRNCPECGSPNDPDAGACEYCDAAL